MPKDDPDVKNWISNYLEQQELPSSTCSIATTVLSEACCEGIATLEASLICCPSGNIACSSIAWSVFSVMTKQNVVVLILISSQSTSFPQTSALEQRVLVLKCDKENKGGFRIL